MRTLAMVLGVLVTAATSIPAKDLGQVPNDFPRFMAVGQEGPLDALRRMYWLYYPQQGGGGTLWDEWLVCPNLWPATGEEEARNAVLRTWREGLDSRRMDEDGYVSTHQHASIAHPAGWPFPAWIQGKGTMGWHFSFKDTVGPPWRGDVLSTTTGWLLQGARDAGVGEWGWRVVLEQPQATLTFPAHPVDSFQSPFLQIRWKAEGLAGAHPFIEWTNESHPEFTPDCRQEFPPASGDKIVYTLIPLHEHPNWSGTIRRFRLGFDNPKGDIPVTIQAVFTTYDTRHNVNSQSFIDGCAAYFHWTGDIDFLRRNINRMRLALRHLMTVHDAGQENIVHTTWVGHDGRPGFVRDAAGAKTFRYGHGIGNNYWDLIPFGAKDAYATVRYYGALQTLAALEREIDEHPGWNIPGGPLRRDPAWLLQHAQEVKETGNRLFWNEAAGRFVGCIDEDGVAHDHGFTFLNLEAIHYDFATPDHAQAILDWISGRRIVAGDTSTGEDIYHWRFAPRATTRRNVDYYYWAWTAPESIPFGGQVQDGGAVLGFSYHDVMARLKVRGPDDAWERLKVIADWFGEVQKAGGYRAYYSGQREGTLQGSGTAGGLGMDEEFMESILVPTVVLDGFLGFTPAGDGFRLHPRLPSGFSSLRVDRIRFHDLVLDVEASRESITIRKTGESAGPVLIDLPANEWRMSIIQPDGALTDAQMAQRREAGGRIRVEWQTAAGVVFRKEN